MRNQRNVCETCLCFGRKLVSTSAIHKELQEIQFRELQNKSICWECHTIIIKFYRLKLQAKNAQLALSDKLQECKSYSKLLHTTKNTYDFVFTHTYELSSETTEPTDIESENDIKEEVIEETKQEIIEETNTLEEFDIPIQYDSEDDKNLLVENKEDIPAKERSLIKNKRNHIKKKYKILFLKEEDVVRKREEKKTTCHSYKTSPYKCDNCVLGFMTLENYNLHVEVCHHESLGDYCCNICLVRFSKKTSLKNHVQRHFSQYFCKLCEFKTFGKLSVETHCRRKHANDEKNKIHCSMCIEVFRSSEELTEHTKTEHLCCNDCGKIFKQKYNLKLHRIRTHSEQRKFVCDICNSAFITKSRLECHMMRHEQAMAKKLAYCGLCKMQFKSIHIYRNHMKNSNKHSSNRYQCSECNKFFASETYLKVHYNFYHLKQSQYKCEECNKLFKSKWEFNLHTQTHHGLGRPRNHSCDQCGKKFYTVRILRSHILTHSDYRSFMCSVCGDTFKQSAGLYIHERRVHRGNSIKGVKGQSKKV